jgi:L-ribulokinase
MQVNNSKELVSSVFNYPSGELGVLVDSSSPLLARQNPQDYIDGLVTNIREVINSAENTLADFHPAQIKALGFATTGSTIIPVDNTNTPLALQDEFKHNLNAHAWLWKDHTSYQEAQEINRIAGIERPEYLLSCGGSYSSEWFWSKIWHLKNCDPQLFEQTDNYIELCDFLPALLAGINDPTLVQRSICAAGHKALYSDKWGGLPDKSFLTQCDPALATLRDRLFDTAVACDQIAGRVNPFWAKETGLAPGTLLAVGGFDAHLGAVGAGIQEGNLIKIMGTSTCDLIISANEKTIEGVCGTVKDSVIPGYIGIEAGQSAVGDIFLWLVNHLVPQSYGDTQDEKFANLNRLANELKPGQSGLLALDWNNGNRCVLTDMQLSGLLIGQTLHTKAHEIYRTLIEATAFGALKIIERLNCADINTRQIICCGGLAQKNPMMMQIYADVTDCEIRVCDTEQTCAVGAAIAAASVHSQTSLPALQKTMTTQSSTVYQPTPSAVAVYKKLYSLYNQLHDSFGVDGTSFNHFEIMKTLNQIRQQSYESVSSSETHHA